MGGRSRVAIVRLGRVRRAASARATCQSLAGSTLQILSHRIGTKRAPHDTKRASRREMLATLDAFDHRPLLVRPTYALQIPSRTDIALRHAANNLLRAGPRRHQWLAVCAMAATFRGGLRDSRAGRTLGSTKGDQL